jgi:hypothetical protein
MSLVVRRAVIRATNATTAVVIGVVVGGIIRTACLTDFDNPVVGAARLTDMTGWVVATTALADVAGGIVGTLTGERRGDGERRNRSCQKGKFQKVFHD